MSKGNTESSKVEKNIEDWREPATQDEKLPDKLVEVVVFDPSAVLEIKAYAERKFEDTNLGVKIKASSDKEQDR